MDREEVGTPEKNKQTKKTCPGITGTLWEEDVSSRGNPEEWKEGKDWNKLVEPDGQDFIGDLW